MDGYLPDAEVVFLDEIWKASPAIQNALLTAINEHIFKNGSETLHLPMKALIAASNELSAEDECIEAMWDRFLVRMVSNCISSEKTFFKMVRSRSIEEPFLAECYLINDELYRKWLAEIDEIEITDDVCRIVTHIRKNASDDKGISLENATTILIKEAENMSQQYEQDIQESLNNKTSEEVMQKTKTYAIQDRYKPFVECIKLPKFCIKVSKNYGVFGITKDFVPLTQETLLEDFKLSKEDKRIDFSYNNTNIKKIDIDQNDEDNIITTSLKEKEAMALDNFYGNINDKDRLIFLLAQYIRKNITRDNSISDADLNKYITSVLEEQELSQLRNLGRNSSNTTQASSFS